MTTTSEDLIAYIVSLPCDTNATTIVTKSMEFLNSFPKEAALTGSDKKQILLKAIKELPSSSLNTTLPAETLEVLQTMLSANIIHDLIDTAHNIALGKLNIGQVTKDIEEIKKVSKANLPLLCSLKNLVTGCIKGNNTVEFTDVIKIKDKVVKE